MVENEKMLESLKAFQKKYDFDTKEWTIEVISSKFSNRTGTDEEGNLYDIDDTSEIYIPPYQRAYRWNELQKSEFIESLLLGMPIPYIYLAGVDEIDGTPDDEWRLEIVDGSQRIRTIHKFLSNEFALQNLKQLSFFNWFKFSDFPEVIKRKFLRISIKWIELNGISLEDRKDFFRRINGNSTPLISWEIRKWVYQESNFYTMLEQMYALPLVKELLLFSDKKLDKQEPFEYLTRFFCYYDQFDLYKWNVSQFLYDYIDKNQNISDLNIQEKKDLIIETFSFVKKYFPHWFIKPEKNKDSGEVVWGNSKILKSRVYFEAISVWVALALKEKKINNIDSKKIESYIVSSDFFEKISSDWANNVSKFKDRINSIKNLLLSSE